MDARVTLNIQINDGTLGGQCAGTTLTLTEADLKALGYRWRDDSAAEPAHDDKPASADVAIAFLGAMIDDSMESCLQSYRDAGARV